MDTLYALLDTTGVLTYWTSQLKQMLLTIEIQFGINHESAMVSI